MAARDHRTGALTRAAVSVRVLAGAMAAWDDELPLGVLPD
jgi:hypothetical protein